MSQDQKKEKKKKCDKQRIVLEVQRKRLHLVTYWQRTLEVGGRQWNKGRAERPFVPRGSHIL